MFDKIKQLNELRKMRSQALELQKELEKITVSIEKNGVTVVVSGDQKIKYIKNGDLEENEIRDAVNEAMKEVQKKSAKKMMEMGGGLSGLLKGMG